MNQKKLKICSGIITKIFTPKHRQQIKDTKKCLYSFDLPSIGKVQNGRITAKISTDEIQKAIRKLKSDKLVTDFHLSGTKNLKKKSPVLLRAFIWTITKDNTPPSWKEAIANYNSFPNH